MNMLEEEFPERAKELNDEEKEGRKKNKSETRKERKENVDRTHSTLANQRASMKEEMEESKKDKKTSKYTHACQGDYCLSTTFETLRPKVKSPEALCRKCLDLKRNLKATSQMETLFFRLITNDTREHQLRPIYVLFESTATSATTQEDLINAIRKVAGATELE